jgi:hypothetical protein
MSVRLLAVVSRLSALIIGGYLLSLVAVSLLSNPRLVPTGATQRFCGLYLDCHRMVTVESVRYADTVPGQRAAGRYALVTVRLASDAAGVTLRSGMLGATLRGVRGKRYPRDHDAERELAAAGTAAGLPNVPLPAGVPTRSTIVFDIPADAGVLQLRIHDAGWLTRLSELFLIGDEDSFLHARTWWVLEPPANLAVSRAHRPLCGVTGGCDTVVRVVRVERASRAGLASRRVPADGVFYLVTLEVSDADSGAPSTEPLVAKVEDGLGRSYGRARDVEQLLDEDSRDARLRRLAFDLPDDVTTPQLVLRKPGPLNRLAAATRLPLPGGAAPGPSPD